MLKAVNEESSETVGEKNSKHCSQEHEAQEDYDARLLYSSSLDRSVLLSGYV